MPPFELAPLAPLVPLAPPVPLLGMAGEFPELVVSEGAACGVVSGALAGGVSGAVDGWLSGLEGAVGDVCDPEGVDGVVDGVA